MLRKWVLLSLMLTFFTSGAAFADWSNSGGGHDNPGHDKEMIGNSSGDFQKYKDPEDDDPLVEPSDEDEGVIFWFQSFFLPKNDSGSTN